MIKPYAKAIDVQMLELYRRLLEKSRRLYAGVEALKLPYGGISYMAKLFDCSRDTVLKGIKELSEKETLPQNQSRKAGGGRKPVLEKEPDLNAVFLGLIKEHTAGDPMDDSKK
jgi:hypothetical protein